MPRSKGAAKSFAQFHGRPSDKTVRVNVPTLKMPARMFALGKLREIVYERPDDKTPYLHKFRKPFALLCSDARGRRLYIVGGGFKVTPRGIVR